MEGIYLLLGAGSISLDRSCRMPGGGEEGVYGMVQARKDLLVSCQCRCSKQGSKVRRVKLQFSGTADESC